MTFMGGSPPSASSPSLLRMSRIAKSFGPNRVLREVDFELKAGEVHVLAGENGAGKSTLIRILGGALAADEGMIAIEGGPARLRRPRDAAERGIAVIHQELSLVGSMSVADNLLLGHEPGRAGWIDRPASAARARLVLERVGLRLDPNRLVSTLPISAQQLVEIAKALALGARIIVMDEPTSALSEPEARRLFARIADLRSQGCGIIYITHRLDEILALADRITVLRDGRVVASRPAGELPVGELVRLMVGRSIGDQAPRRAAAAGTVRLDLRRCRVRGEGAGRRPIVEDAALQVRSGEILGLVGLEGSGVSELLWAMFGALGRRADVEMEIDGRPQRLASPREAIEAGLALVTNDRRRTGLVPGMDVVENATLAALPRFSRLGWLRRREEIEQTARTAGQLNLRCASLRQPVSTLSGGNQQKVVLARWMATNPRVLLLDDPTRGVDVGAKHEIYLLMNEWSRRGCGIILSSSEWPELLQVSDRIMVMHRGRVAAAFRGGQATAADLLRAAMGHATDE